ncbi:hypothetical protein BH24ACT11_BH24ACT11_00100 [soil metagenome]
MSASGEVEAPRGTSDERELLLRWLNHQRMAVIRKYEGLSDRDAHWTNGGR